MISQQDRRKQWQAGEVTPHLNLRAIDMAFPYPTAAFASAAPFQEGSTTKTLKLRSFSSKQLGFVAAGSGNCMDRTPRMYLVGTGLDLLKLLLHHCTSHSHKQGRTGAKGGFMKCSHIQK